MTGTNGPVLFAGGLGLLALVAAGFGVRAQAPADIGRKLAEKGCAACHAIGKTGKSPLSTAPPLRDFARKWPLDQLEEALAEGIVTGHPGMPEFQFEPDDIAALIAYLDEIAE